MSKILIIAEKPSVANKISCALQSSNKSKHQGYFEDEKYIISNCFGHLFELLKPFEIDERYKEWNINNLPMKFSKIPYKAKDDSGIKNQIKTLKELLNRNDVIEVVNACDADREGELIFRDIFNFSKCQKPASRMWIESMADNKVIKETFDSRISQEEYKNLYISAVARRYTDYLIGMNASSAMNIKYNTKVSLGRVQTVTLRIIVDLEKQINDFISKPFWTLVAQTDKFDAKHTEIYENKMDADSLINKIGIGQALVEKMKKFERQEKASKLYNLSDLQIEMNRRYHLSAQTVLNTCQSLYEEFGLITYPRTSENRISTELANKTNIIVDCLPNIFNLQKRTINTNKYTINESCIAKKDIGSHEALTPTTKQVSDELLDSLSDIQLKIYKAIVERFLSNFYPNAIYTVQEIELNRGNEHFKTKIESIKDYGFYNAYLQKPEFEAKEFININEGDYVNINNYILNEGKTTPPSRFTEGSLIKTMTNPTKYVNDAESKKVLKETQGLGTEATRAQILETLKNRKYIEIIKSQIHPTELGIKLIELIPSETMKSIPLTVTMEQNLKEIQLGKLNAHDYLNGVYNFCEDFVTEVKNAKQDTIDTKKGGNNMTEICKCPQCNSPVVETKFGYSCSGYKEGCKVSIFFNAVEKLGKKKINKTEAKELLTKGKTSKKSKGFVSTKTGKEYEAFMNYSYEENEKYPNKINISFE